jgi:hypothetical protein
VPDGGGKSDPAIEKVLIGKDYYTYVRKAAIWTDNEYVD